MYTLKHTPGPWSILYNNEIIERVKPTSKISGLTIMGCTDEGLSLVRIAEVSLNIKGIGAEKKFDGDVTEANAKLIAAAPDLLQALISARNELAKHIIFYEYPDLVGPINDAIVKATK